MPEYNKTLIEQLRAHKRHIYAVHSRLNVHASAHEDALAFNAHITNTKAFLCDVGTELNDIINTSYNGMAYSTYTSHAHHYFLNIKITSDGVKVEFTIKGKITKSLNFKRLQGADKTEVKRLINEMRFHLI